MHNITALTLTTTVITGITITIIITTILTDAPLRKNLARLPIWMATSWEVSQISATQPTITITATTTIITATITVTAMTALTISTTAAAQTPQATAAIIAQPEPTTTAHPPHLPKPPEPYTSKTISILPQALPLRGAAL